MPRTAPPAPLLARRHAGQDPFEEVFFLEASPGPGQGLWLRYTLAAEAGAIRHAVWAVVVDGDRIHAERVEGRGAATADGDRVFEAAAGHLSRTRAVGRAGRIGWDLGIGGGWRSHDHVPTRVEALGLTGRHYASAALDAVLDGTVEVDGTAWAVRSAPAVLGHIWGNRASARTWAWCHCARFVDAEDAFFEGLTARLGVGGLTLPWATSLVLHHGGERQAFSRTRHLFTIDTRVDAVSWRFAARGRGRTLRGHARLPRARRVARLAYDHVGDDHRYVRNSPLAALDLSLVDDRRGVITTLSSRRASFEIATDTPFDEGWHLRG